MVQHLLFKDHVNKKFDVHWLISANMVKKILEEKGLPFERKRFARKIVFTLEPGIEIVITPCESYLHPRHKKLRWVVTSQGKISDFALRPLTDETFPIIDKLTMQIDASIQHAPESHQENGT